MQKVISADQAKQITGGRTPLVPVEYESACRALAECITLDEAKYWDNKADTLAAWAKIYRSDEAAVQAKRLKLHAYRRMAVLAEELRPSMKIGVSESDGSRRILPGARSLLLEKGLSISQATSALRIGTLQKVEFDNYVNLSRPPAPSVIRAKCRHGSESWKELSTSLMQFRSWTRRHQARELAGGIEPDESERARTLVLDITEWLDEFEQHLPNQSP